MSFFISHSRGQLHALCESYSSRQYICVILTVSRIHAVVGVARRDVRAVGGDAPARMIMRQGIIAGMYCGTGIRRSVQEDSCALKRRA